MPAAPATWRPPVAHSNQPSHEGRSVSPSPPAVTPSIIPADRDRGFTLDQELTQFGRWTSEPMLVPPKDATGPMAETILRRHRPWVDRRTAWRTVIGEHRSLFTRVQQIEMKRASIRLPQGRLFVSVTPRDRFDQIEETIPACVQTRLDEFMDGPMERLKAKVYYLKPLCVEIGDELIFTTRSQIDEAIAGVKDDVFSEVRRLAIRRLPKRAATASLDAATWPVRRLTRAYLERRERAVERLYQHLECKRRKTALKAMRLHQRCRTHGCTFDEMLDLTNPLETSDVIEHYAEMEQVSVRRRNEMLSMAAGHMPWFFALAMGTFQTVTTAMAVHAAMVAPAVLMCDPAFVAEIPGRGGQLLKIGHFDEIGGVTHVEI